MKKVNEAKKLLDKTGFSVKRYDVLFEENQKHIEKEEIQMYYLIKNKFFWVINKIVLIFIQDKKWSKNQKNRKKKQSYWKMNVEGMKVMMNLHSKIMTPY